MFNYFNGSLSRGFVSLYCGRMIQYIGHGLIVLFIPIYLLTVYNGRIELVLLFYLIGHLTYGLFLPLGVQSLNKIGLRKSLIISNFLFAGYFVCLFLLEYQVLAFSLLALLVLMLSRTMFWLPYHTDLAKFTDKANRGKSISLLWATYSLLAVIIPVISGFLIGRFGYTLVFILAIIIYLISIIAYVTLPRTKERYSWGYLETFQRFFSRKNKKLVLANMANGAENAVSIIIWPIFIWQILKGNYFAVGAISSLIVLATIAIQLGIGHYTDKLDKRKMIHWGSFLYASGWLAKVFVATSFQVFIVGTYHSFTQIFKDTPFDALNYELLSDHGHFIDEYTVLKEIAVQWGKVLVLVIAIAVVLNFSINWTFALAALASLFITLL